jgi:hypothetical protein
MVNHEPGGRAQAVRPQPRTVAVATHHQQVGALGRLDHQPLDPALQPLLTALQALPRDAELLAVEAGCEDYCERDVDEVEWQGGRVYLHLGARRDDSLRP